MAKREYFPKVREAREALREKAESILNQYLKVVDEAQKAGQYDVAAKSLQWLIEHMPEDEAGQRMIEGSIDKQKVDTKPTGPSVQIGIQLGGLNKKKELPEPVIEVTSEPVK